MGQAAACLVELYGSARPKEAAAFLMQYQSCTMRKMLLSLYLQATEPNNRQSIFLRQHQRLQNLSFNPNAHDLPATNVTADFLRDNCPAWQRLDCTASPLDILDRLPPQLYVLALKISPSQDALYATVCGAGGATVAITRIPWREEHRQKLLQLRSQMAGFRREVGKYMLLYGDEAGQFGDLCRPPPADADPSKAGTKSANDANNKESTPGPSPSSQPAPANAAMQAQVAGPSAIPEFPDHLEATLAEVVEATESLLQPVFAAPHIATVLTAIATIPKAALVLLLDEDFLHLSIEAIPSMRQTRITNVSRDFSLHFLHHRLVCTKELAGGKFP